MARNKRRLSVTGHYINEKSPDGIFHESPPAYPVPKGRRPLGRLRWSGPLDWTIWNTESMSRTIKENSLQNALFFADTNFFTTPINDNVWQAILTRNLIITPMIRRELEPWLDRPRANYIMRDRVLNAIKNGSKNIHFDFVDPIMKLSGYEYYARLLGLRKLKGMAFAIEFERERGRPPTDEEFAAKMKKQFKDRGFMLAKKGWKEYGRPNYFADEQLVVMAVLSAILSGNEVVILTRDHDVEEQFYKLIYLIDTHYRSMLLAKCYAINPNSFPKVLLNSVKNYKPDRFVGDDNFMFNPIKGRLDWLKELLPPSPHSLMIECWWMTGGPDSVTNCRMAFCAEQEMREILHVKGSTSGLNTNLLSGKNCHIWPFPAAPRQLTIPVIATDKIVNVLGWNHIALDMIHSLCSREGHTNTYIKSISVDPKN